MNDLFKLIRLCAFILVAAVNTGCSSIKTSPLPYESWFFGFFAPKYLEVWIETADITDVDGNFYPHAMSGNASIQRGANDTGAPTDWPPNPGWGKGKNVEGANLPKTVYVRWQSLAEPQTYEAYIQIPEATRILMLKKEKVFCAAENKWKSDYKKGMVFGLAPSGVVKAWISGACSDAVEVVRVKATIVRVGPYGGKTKGEYGDLSPEARLYIDQHGVPKGAW